MTVLRILMPLALAIGLIWLIVAYAGLDLVSVQGRLLGLGAWWPLIGAASALQIGLSAEKWKRALDALDDDPSRRMPFGMCFFYTALAAVMSQIMTVYVAAIAVRALATRFHKKLGLVRGAASSGFEQLFDVAVLAVIALPTIIVLAFDMGAGVWLGLTALAALAGFALLGRTPAIVAFLRRVAPKGRIGRLLNDPSVDRLSSPRLAAQFFTLSSARFAVIFGRVAVIAAAAGLWVGLSDLLVAFGAGQLSQLAALTPGNIGLFEWSWVGVLSLRGHPVALALELAIVIRVATFVSFVALTALSAIWLVAARSRVFQGPVL